MKTNRFASALPRISLALVLLVLPLAGCPAPTTSPPEGGCDNDCGIGSSCTDRIKNGDETDIDCGGSCSTKCDPGRACAKAADCLTGVCTSGQCGATCDDKLKDQSETDVDCGGFNACERCKDGKACTAGTDCASRVCDKGACQAPSCTDRAMNGDEADVDCGGTFCSPCALGKRCTTGRDCGSGLCQNGVCADNHCQNGMKDPDEGDVDCGGSCRACEAGRTCNKAADCSSSVCTMGTCQAPTCSDATKNAMETDVDCGGPDCPKCGAGLRCTTDGDCQTMKCAAGLCAGPCENGVKDGAETDVDCGGPACAKCFVGKACKAGSDCATLTCTANMCAGKALFSAPVNNNAPDERTEHVGVGDFDGNGKLDLMASSHGTGGIADPGSAPFFPGNGDGTFGAAVAQRPGTNPADISLGDINGDKNLDAVFAMDTGAAMNPMAAVVLLGRGNGLFQLPQAFAAGGSGFAVLAVEAVGDATLDIVIANGNKGTVSVLSGDGKGAFLPAVSSKAGSYPRALAVADLDGDKIPDLLAGDSGDANWGGGSVLFLKGAGKGAFVTPVTVAPAGYPTAGDLNGDGKLDVVAGDPNQVRVQVALGRGGGTFAAPVAYAGGGGYVVVADINKDGKADVVSDYRVGVPPVSNSGAAIFIGNGDGTLQTPIRVEVNTTAAGIAVADVNADGKPDIVITNGAGLHQKGVSVLLNQTP